MNDKAHSDVKAEYTRPEIQIVKIETNDPFLYASGGSGSGTVEPTDPWED